MSDAKQAARTGSHTGDAHPSTVAFSVLLRGALPPTVVAGVVTAAIIWAMNGTQAGVSALIGVVITVAFFASGLLVMSRVVVDTGNPMLFMAVGMAVYFAQVIALFGVLWVGKSSASFDTRAAGIAILVCVLVWQAAQMRAWRRARVPVYDNAGSGTGSTGGPA